MSSNDTEIREQIAALLNSQQLAVLATQRNGQPYTSLMAFAYSEDLTQILVATGTSTRKHQNLLHDSRVSLLIDNRGNTEADFHQAEALTALGRAQLIEIDERPQCQQLYLRRHPYLEKFLNSPSTAFYKIVIGHYLLVSRFQNVMEYHLQDDYALFTSPH